MSIIDGMGIRVQSSVRERIASFTEIDAERVKSQGMATMIRAGLTVEYVARHYGVHRTTVWRRVRAIPPEAIGRARQALG